jgi:hypothetical protein
MGRPEAGPHAQALRPELVSTPASAGLSARIGFASLVGNASAAPRFQEVVWGRIGKLGNPPSPAAVLCVRKGQAAARPG